MVLTHRGSTFLTETKAEQMMRNQKDINILQGMIKQQMVLVIARSNVNPNLLPPLQIIIPTLALAAPFSLYTSMGQRIASDNLYQGLVENLQKTQGQSSLTDTLRKILQQRKHTNFRVCILGGQKVNWDIALQYKRKHVMIDVVGNNIVLNQVSYTTGGIAKDVREEDMIRQFLTVFSMSKTTRSLFQLEENKKVSFNLQCKMCRPSHFFTEDFRVCSVCLEVFCPQKAVYQNGCPKCKNNFDQEETLLAPKAEFEAKLHL